MLIVGNIGTEKTSANRFFENDIVSFFVEDEGEEKGARADYTWSWPKTSVRPVLEWKTESI